MGENVSSCWPGLLSSIPVKLYWFILFCTLQPCLFSFLFSSSFAWKIYQTITIFFFSSSSLGHFFGWPQGLNATIFSLDTTLKILWHTTATFYLSPSFEMPLQAICCPTSNFSLMFWSKICSLIDNQDFTWVYPWSKIKHNLSWINLPKNSLTVKFKHGKFVYKSPDHSQMFYTQYKPDPPWQKKSSQIHVGFSEFLEPV